MTLEERLRRQIKRDGPLRLDLFLAQVLYAHDGYYQQEEVVGREGDFITAPEISQIFGELLGLWAAHSWERLGRPAPFRLIELGPGSGQLMEDALRATASVSGFHQALRLELVEVHPRLRQRQSERLVGFSPKFHSTPESLWKTPLPFILLANEFLDALPVRQFCFIKGRWRERFVGLDGKGELSTLLLTSAGVDLGEGDEGDVREINRAAEVVVSEVSRALMKTGGAALFCDYGYEEPYRKASVQAVFRHQKQGLLERIGQADISALVNFSRLKSLAESMGISCSGPVEQGAFLQTVGGNARLEQLMQSASPKQKEEQVSAFNRLTAPDQMGQLYKCLLLERTGSRPTSADLSGNSSPRIAPLS